MMGCLLNTCTPPWFVHVPHHMFFICMRVCRLNRQRRRVWVMCRCCCFRPTWGWAGSSAAAPSGSWCFRRTQSVGWGVSTCVRPPCSCAASRPSPSPPSKVSTQPHDSQFRVPVSESLANYIKCNNGRVM